jgi:hypothetical protein
LFVTPTNVRVVIRDAVQAALQAAVITLPFYSDKTMAPPDDDSALLAGYIDVDWTGVGRQGPIATGLESGILGPTFRAWTPRGGGQGAATEIGGVILKGFQRHPQLNAPEGDAGDLYYRGGIPAQELGMDARGLYRADTTILFNHYDPTS